MNRTKINWTDATWNPASGCRKVSPGCKFCYAETLAERKRGTKGFPNGFDPMMRPWKLREPYRLKEPSLVFVNSTSDLFLEEFPHDYRDKVFDVIEDLEQHRFQVLTKRPEVALEYIDHRRRPLPRNVWLGVSIESNPYVARADVLRRIDATVRFISAEPLLGPLADLDLTGIHWLITGGESGDHLSRSASFLDRRGLVRRTSTGGWVPREDRMDWVRDLAHLCAAHGVAFWHKQWGGRRPDDGGRELDGQQHDGMPLHVPGAMPASPTNDIAPLNLEMFGEVSR